VNEVDAIFDAIGRASRLMLLNHQRNEKAEQLRSIKAHRCGNCALWMTSHCKPEAERGQLKSMNSPGCNDFELKDIGGLIPKFESELQDIDDAIGAGEVK